MIPTHLRFKYQSDAAEWNATTTKFLKIDEIQIGPRGWEIATNQFAWIYVTPKTWDRFEFKTEFK